MERLISWYWQHGIRRGEDETDPDRESRKVSIGNWLDPVARTVRRAAESKANAGARPCVALWGPSQTGKSTLLSRYIDGERADGSDSAMTWRGDAPVRFSPSIDRAVPAGTLIFNPYNHNSDASGVATRYTLANEVDDPLHPVQMKIVTRAQIVHAFSLGYFSECLPVGESLDLTQDAFLERLSEPGRALRPLPDAFAILRDAADVMELMRNHHRFNHLFRRGDWERKVRPSLVSAPSLVTDVSAAEAFVNEMFWDGSVQIGTICRDVLSLRESLLRLWGEKPVCLSQEAASLLLDIDTFRNFADPQGENGRIVADKVRRIRWEDVGNRICVDIGAQGSREISGPNFGCFQALCGELVVPLRADALTAERKAPFRTFVDKCDILDLPGLSNVNLGNAVGGENSARLDSERIDPTVLLTRVFKEGKTQCFVHNYARGLGIDAFMVLVRAGQSPSKSDLINDGICGWLRSYDPDWQQGRRSELPVFIDMTFFAKVLNDVAMNGVGNGLLPVLDRVQAQLIFSTRNVSRWFVTNYGQFPDGVIQSPARRDAVLTAIAEDATFLPETGLSREDISAVYEEDGGTGRMFERISAAIDPEKRRNLCKLRYAEYRATLKDLVARLLPSETEEDDRGAVLKRLLEKVEQQITEAEQTGTPNGFDGLVDDVKSIFSVSADTLDPLPRNMQTTNPAEISKYVRAQCVKWYESKVQCAANMHSLPRQETGVLLTVLRDGIDVRSVSSLLRGPGFGTIGNSRTAMSARSSLALVLENQISTGGNGRTGIDNPGERNPLGLAGFLEALQNKTAQREFSPGYQLVIAPALERIRYLAENGIGVRRPPQCGDAELKVIADEL